MAKKLGKGLGRGLDAIFATENVELTTDSDKIVEISLEEKYNVSLNKEEEENMDSVVIKVTIPRYVNKEVKDENFSDM